jgi:hypothetical protein
VNSTEAAADVQDAEAPEVLDGADTPEAAADVQDEGPEVLAEAAADVQDEEGPEVLDAAAAPEAAAGAIDDEPGTAVGCGAAGAAAEDDDAAVAAPGVDSTSRPVTSDVSLRYAALTSSKKLSQPR